MCPLKGKCQYECIVYKIEGYNDGPNNNNNNGKNVFMRSTKELSKKIL